MRPLALGEEGSGSAAAAPKMTAFDFFMGSDSGAAGASPQRDAGARGRARSETGGVGVSGGSAGAHGLQRTVGSGPEKACSRDPLEPRGLDRMRA